MPVDTANTTCKSTWESNYKKIGSPKLWDCAISNVSNRRMHLFSTNEEELFHIRYLLTGIETNDYQLERKQFGEEVVLTTPVFHNNPRISPNGNILECAVAISLDKHPECKVFVGDISGPGVETLLKQFRLADKTDIQRVGAIPVSSVNVYSFESFIKGKG